MDDFEGWCTNACQYSTLFLSGYLGGDGNHSGLHGDGIGRGFNYLYGGGESSNLRGDGGINGTRYFTFYYRWRT
jgi:hypothetical protein